MTIQERAEKANPYSPGTLQYEPWNEGYIGAINGEEWKNLYGEGLEVGMKMLRDYDEQRIVKCLQWISEQGWAGSNPIWENGEDEHYTTMTSEELYKLYTKYQK